MTDSERGADVHFPPPLVFLIAIGVGTAMHWFVYRLQFNAKAGMLQLIGLGIVTLGIALMAWAVNLFRKTGQEPEPWKPSPVMISNGPYRFTRNPMYIG